MKLLTSAVTLILLTAAIVNPQNTTFDGQANGATTGTITGRVVNESGEPLADVLVTIRAFSSALPPQNAVSDRDGKFRVTGLSPVVYLASASLPAYTPAARDPDSTQATSYRIGDDINLVLLKGGVIAGTVTTSNGDPVVGISVRAQMIRDGTGQKSRYGATARERVTDDRGNYRIYGLPAGTYLVMAGGGSRYFGVVNGAYENDAPTYSPSSVRDTAAEINVRAGEEITNVDIRYRSEPGRVISGNASGPLAQEPYSTSIILTSTLDGGPQLSESVYQEAGGRGFTFTGVADGNYYLTAESFFPGGELGISDVKRIKVTGTDVTDVELVTKPLGSISGRVVLEESKAVECKGKKKVLNTEILISAWHNQNEAAKDRPQFVWGLGGPAYPNSQGDISLRNLAPGQYQIIARQFAKYWYLRSISLPAQSQSTKPNQTNRPHDAVLNWTILRPGDRISGLTVTIAEGAASLRGQVTTAEGNSLPERMFVYLVPAERDKSQDVLRFFAVPVAGDKSIAFNNIPPGLYLMVIQPALDNFGPTLTKLRLPDETETRERLRREAEAAKVEIEFKPCQNVVDFQLPFNLSGTPITQPANSKP
jgi:hypothetical protein